MSNILVTGATGFLGKHLVKQLLSDGHNVVGIGNSETRAKYFEALFSEAPLYLLDISSDFAQLKKIVKKHNIEYVIHCAAFKHVNLCEINVIRAVDININGTKNIINTANELGIKNVIGISTDKSINPSCVYGMTKKISEEMLRNENFGIFQGVNYLYSTGSVLEIWEKQMKENKKITVNTSATRYFSPINDVVNTIIDNIETKEHFSTNVCYKISIGDLQKAFSIFFDYHEFEEYNPLSVEKTIEEIPENVTVVEPTVQEIVELIKAYKINEI